MAIFRAETALRGVSERKEAKRNETRAKTGLSRSTDDLNDQVLTILADLSFGVFLIRNMLDRRPRMFQIDQTRACIVAQDEAQ